MKRSADLNATTARIFEADNHFIPGDRSTASDHKEIEVLYNINDKAFVKATVAAVFF